MYGNVVMEIEGHLRITWMQVVMRDVEMLVMEETMIEISSNMVWIDDIAVDLR